MIIKTIYIIDDEEQTADMLGEFIRLMGYQSIVYIQAKQFFKETDAHIENSIVILDLHMPEMDGVEVMRLLAENGNPPPLILVSGYDSGVLHSAEQLAKAHSLEIIATIGKPLQFQELRDAINMYISGESKLHNKIQTNAIQFTAPELKQAIFDKQLILHYQPQIDINTGSLFGVEALVRWQHPEHGLIYPNLFITLAENSGLIGDLTTYVIDQALNQALEWKSEGLMIQISVNISADNVNSLSLPEQLSNQLDSNKLDPSLLTLEVTESALMGKLVTALDILTRLRMKGIELSIDDFGTGYSSLSQLYRAPFTELKVDQSFVKNMAHDKEARGIVKTCIMLGHELKMQVVAEGVEDKETLQLLKEIGCDIAQGFYIAEPMSSSDLIEWSKNHLK